MTAEENKIINGSDLRSFLELIEEDCKELEPEIWDKLCGKLFRSVSSWAIPTKGYDQEFDKAVYEEKQEIMANITPTENLILTYSHILKFIADRRLDLRPIFDSECLKRASLDYLVPYLK